MKSNVTTTTGNGRAINADVVETRLSIVVPFTTLEMTKAALKHAVDLSAGLNAAIRLIDAEVVPFQRPLGEPPVNREFQMNRLQEIAEEAGTPVQTEIVYTRDRMECFRRKVEIGSLIVISTAAVAMPLWPTAGKKLARCCRRPVMTLFLSRAPRCAA